MSAIVGIHYPDSRPVHKADLGHMIDALAHRGPDGAGVWREGSVGLGHRMLWTTPESLHEQLPLMNRRGDLIITADARIDNRNELISRLGLTPCLPDTISDSEIILAAYERWGESCPIQLLGDFTFAIWDVRRQKLFCARDYFGVRPFYYYATQSLFAFATEIRALLVLPEIPHRINELRVADYLVPLFEDNFSTFYQGIYRLPPAHCLTVHAGQVRTWEYWSPDPTYELQLKSDADYAETYRAIFSEAVHCRTRSAFPVGSMLSGGLDSSSIACLARNKLADQNSGPLHTFSAIFDDLQQCDERQFINAVLAQGGFNPHYIHGDQFGPLTDLDRVLWHTEEPFFAYNLFLHWQLWVTAQQHGVRVVLDGLTGDDVVSHGLSYLTDLTRTFRWRTLLNQARGLAHRYYGGSRRATLFFLREYALKPLMPVPLWLLWRMVDRREISHDDTALLQPAFAQRVGITSRVRALAIDQNRTAPSARLQNWRQITSGMIPFGMEMANKAAARFAIEPRFPFLDRRVVEFCLALPPSQKLHDGWTRLIVRNALAGVLPEEVRWRKDKANIAPNFDRGLLHLDGEQLDDLILHNPGSLAAYVNLPALRAIYHRSLQDSGGDDIIPVWLAATLSSWLRHTMAISESYERGGGDQQHTAIANSTWASLSG